MKISLFAFKVLKINEKCRSVSGSFFIRAVFLSIMLFTKVIFTELSAQRLSRDLSVDLLINQIGYMPDAVKSVSVKGELYRNFEVIDLQTREVVYKGTLSPVTCDFGGYSRGDFSDLKKEGYYYVKSDTLRSFPFRISASIYHPAIDMIVGYFSLQRCGSSTTGFLSPCHLDDGKRLDNGKHQDVTGGWHDASDLRKWVGATIYGMLGLAKTYELYKGDNKKAILEELMWGNQYFLKMQEPQGYVMSFIGGDVNKHSDSNRWTDNEISPEGGELRMVKPTTGNSSADLLIFGNSDDRIIQTRPLDILGQYNFITAQAMMARITKTLDVNYSMECLKAAEKCFEWCRKSDLNNPRSIGAAIQASTEMFKTTGEKIYMDFAVIQASLLYKLQADNPGDGPSGFFYTSFSDTEPYKNYSRGCLEFISLCDIIKTFPSHNDATLWKEMISNYAFNYLALIAENNNFRIIPYGLYTGKDPGGNKKAGNYWYRYFVGLESKWLGINANLASAGVGLVKAAEILNDKSLSALAQKQLDWIVGVNPYNSSTIHGIGYNHPDHFGGSTFLPKTPVLPGGVMNGLCGDDADQADIGSGNWQISEYWTPMVAYTLWLMAEFSK